MLADVPAASAKVAAAEAAHVAEIPTGEMGSAAVEAAPIAAVAAAISAIAVAVIRVPPTVTVVVTGTRVRSVVIAAAVVGIARGGAENAANHSCGDRRAGVIAIPVGVAMPVAPYVMMAVSVCDPAIYVPG